MVAADAIGDTRLCRGLCVGRFAEYAGPVQNALRGDGWKTARLLV